MKTPPPKTLVQDYLAAINGKDKSESTLRKYTSDEELIHHVEAFESAFPHYSVEAEDMISEKDEVAVRARFRGVHTGEWMGVAPTGRKVDVPFQIIYHVSKGKIDQHWMAVDQTYLLSQLGVA